MATGARSSGWCAVTRWRAVAAATLLGVGAAGCPPAEKAPAPTRIRWTNTTQPISYASPALSLDGKTVYFGTAWWEEAPPAPGQALLALSTDTGAVRWTYPLGTSEVRSAPAVAPDGSISFVVETRGAQTSAVVHRLSSSGHLLWTYDVNPSHMELFVGIFAIAIGADGAAFVAGDQLYALEPDGQLRWKTLAPSSEAMHAAPVIGSDGTVYLAAHNLPLTAFDPADGSVRWSLGLGPNVYLFGSPAIGADGTIYAAPGATLWAVSSAGELRWTWTAADAGYSGEFRGSPAVGADGTIYLGIIDGYPTNAFFAVTPAGTLKWTFEPTDLPASLPNTNADFESSPALGAGATVYVANEFGHVYALDAANGAVRWAQATAAGIGWPSPTLAEDGTLFIGDLSGRCYAIDTGGAGLDAQAPWPKYRADAQNSGRRP